MLQFDKNGLLVPNDAIPCTLEEFEATFVENIGSESRAKIFQGYLAYSDSLKSLISVSKLRQWINGSFVTTVPNPKDVDLVTFVDYSDVERLGKNLDSFKANGAFASQGVDAYLLIEYPESHPKHFLHHSDKFYWMDLFSNTRQNRQGKKFNKGFLEIFY